MNRKPWFILAAALTAAILVKFSSISHAQVVTYCDSRQILTVQGQVIVPPVDQTYISHFAPAIDGSKFAVCLQPWRQVDNFVNLWTPQVGFQYLCPGDRVAWSENGKTLYVQKGPGYAKIWTLDLKKPDEPGTPKRLTSAANEIVEETPSVGTDGRVYFSPWNAWEAAWPTIFSAQPHSGRVTQLTSNEFYAIGPVFYNGFLLYGRPLDIMVRCPGETGDGHPVTTGWDVATDGQWLYFTDFSTAGYSIFRCRFDGSNRDQVTPGFGFNARVFWPEPG